MTQYLTRRELREAERRGLVVTEATPEPAVEPDLVLETITSEVFEAAGPAIHEVIKQVVEQIPSEVQPVPLTRRELRELEKKGIAPLPPQPSVSEATPLDGHSGEIELPDIEVEDQAVASAEIEQIVATDFTTLDLPPTDFTGTNLLAEPSTQSIVLDVSPEAIALPIETGEIAITGSITVLTDPNTGSLTAGLDGIELDNADRQDAVTGVISIVEPISALDIIGARMNVGVVPKSVLRKGWWRPWAMGLAALIMAVAAILATITILNALGA